MMTREEILEAIRRTAADNGGRPLGRSRFEHITGITEYDIGKYWARYGDAQREAGFEPNTLNVGYDEDFLIEKFVALARELGKIPTTRELRLKRAQDPDFPSKGTFARIGSLDTLTHRAFEYCRERAAYDDVTSLFEARLASLPRGDTETVALKQETKYGFVYLVRGHPGEYKIGRTNLIDRRLAELGPISPVEQKLVHEIKTDDPAGVETYWHARFSDKRMRGEWFKLSAADVNAFKRWRKIY